MLRRTLFQSSRTFTKEEIKLYGGMGGCYWSDGACIVRMLMAITEMQTEPTQASAVSSMGWEELDTSEAVHTLFDVLVPGRHRGLISTPDHLDLYSLGLSNALALPDHIPLRFFFAFASAFKYTSLSPPYSPPDFAS